MLFYVSLHKNIYIRTVSYIQNDNLGCNSVSWAPFSAIGSIQDDGRSKKRLVTGSCDNSVRIWQQTESGWIEEEKASSPHTGMDKLST